MMVLDDIGKDFGIEAASPDLRLMMARAKAVVEGISDVDGVFITSCFRCAEAAIVRNEVRRYINKHSTLRLSVIHLLSVQLLLHC
ncbi:MAG: hypothetical protein R2741_11230 [Methanolobus sp.]